MILPKSIDESNMSTGQARMSNDSSSIGYLSESGGSSQKIDELPPMVTDEISESFNESQNTDPECSIPIASKDEGLKSVDTNQTSDNEHSNGSLHKIPGYKGMFNISNSIWYHI